MAEKYKWFLLIEDGHHFRDQFHNGEVRRMYVNEQFICLTLHNNQWQAFEDKCPHQGKTLLGSSCDHNGMLTCPHHQYKFDIATGRGHGMFIDKYAVKEEGNEVYVGFKRGFFDFL